MIEEEFKFLQKIINNEVSLGNISNLKEIRDLIDMKIRTLESSKIDNILNKNIVDFINSELTAAERKFFKANKFVSIIVKFRNLDTLRVTCVFDALSLEQRTLLENNRVLPQKKNSRK